MAVVSDLARVAPTADVTYTQYDTDRRHPGYISGRRYGPEIASTINNTAMTPNMLFALPFYVVQPVRVVGMAMRIGTAVVGVKGSMGIYSNNNARAMPDRLLAECVGDLDMGGANEVMLPLSRATPLPKGMCWLAAVFDGAAQPTAYNHSVIGGAGLAYMLGGASVLNLNTTSGTIRLTRDAPLAYMPGSLFLPAEFGPASFGTGSPGTPYMAIIVE